MSDQLKIRVVQGLARDVSVQTPNGDGTFGCGFVSTDAISAIIWSGDSTVSVGTPTVIWGNNGSTSAAAGAAITLWTITFAAADTSSLTPGIYRLQVFGTHGAKTATLFDGLLEVLSTAGLNVPSDLVSYTTVELLLARLRLRESEREMLSFLIGECSDAIRKWCGQRDFVRQTYVQEYVPDLNGYCMLEQMPINNVLRVRGYSQTVLTITGQPSAFQQAWVNFSTTGDWYTNTLTYTGLVLNSVSSGVLTSTPFLYASYPTVNQLASAVGSVSGWTARTQPTTYGLYPSTDLMSQGTSQGAITDDGCNLRAYTEDLSWTSLDNATGAFYAGRRRPSCNQFGPQWGDDWQLLEEADSGPTGRIQVTYDAGFSKVPTPVQAATAELVKAEIERLRTETYLRSEDNGVYKYELDPNAVNWLPQPVLQKLAQYRMSRAR
jgi:hypothetical protein